MLIRVPQDWPNAVVAVLAMLVLAALDLAGAWAAKEAVLRRSSAFALVGVLMFVTLFWVYASSLQYAELAPVTFGWVVVLQIGVVLLDRYRYGGSLPADKWVAVAVLLVAQAYLLLGPDRSPDAPAPVSAPQAVVGQGVVGQGAPVGSPVP